LVSHIIIVCLDFSKSDNICYVTLSGVGSRLSDRLVSFYS